MTDLLLAMIVLSSGLKGLLENSGFLIGLPLVALGALGALVALMPVEVRWGERVPVGQVAAEAYEGHPGPETYVKVGLILAVITAIEVAIYYTNLAQGALLGILLVLSALKFVMVVLWFMHLRFDNSLFSTLFTGGVILATGLFIVVLTTLGANLV
ncbi:MAG: cytochrome C oxidase subunit IV family protein [Dehalococcoidia bacterium]